MYINGVRFKRVYECHGLMHTDIGNKPSLDSGCYIILGRNTLSHTHDRPWPKVFGKRTVSIILERN